MYTPGIINLPLPTRPQLIVEPHFGRGYYGSYYGMQPSDQDSAGTAVEPCYHGHQWVKKKLAILTGWLYYLGMVKLYDLGAIMTNIMHPHFPNNRSL